MIVLGADDDLLADDDSEHEGKDKNGLFHITEVPTKD